jgi:Cys-tRNA synthase (O-phospho-L-seryl-tRNA:Cys-tRNA synthase)
MVTRVTKFGMQNFKEYMNEGPFSGVYSVCEYCVKGKTVYIIDGSTKGAREEILEFLTEAGQEIDYKGVEIHG